MQVEKLNSFWMFHHWKSWTFFCLFLRYPVFSRMNWKLFFGLERHAHCPSISTFSRTCSHDFDFFYFLLLKTFILSKKHRVISLRIFITYFLANRKCVIFNRANSAVTLQYSLLSGDWKVLPLRSRRLQNCVKALMY